MASSGFARATLNVLPVVIIAVALGSGTVTVFGDITFAVHKISVHTIPTRRLRIMEFISLGNVLSFLENFLRN